MLAPATTLVVEVASATGNRFAAAVARTANVEQTIADVYAAKPRSLAQTDVVEQVATDA